MNAPERVLRADARRNREAVLDAAAALFAQRGDAVQMDEIAERSGLAVGTLYRHFADKRALFGAIIGRRFAAMTTLAQAAAEITDPWAAFEALLYGYLEAAEADAAFRYALLSPQQPDWTEIADAKGTFWAACERSVQRAVAAGRLRADFGPEDFIVISRGAMANMGGASDWRRYVALVLDGIRG